MSGPRGVHHPARTPQRIAERTRIAREMHDVLAHRMSLVSLQAGALEVRTDARPDQITEAAGAIRVAVHEALQELRAVIGVLRAGNSGRTKPPQPGFADLPDLVAGARSGGMRIDFVCLVKPGEPGEPARAQAKFRLGVLTDREREVALGLGRGWSNAQIGSGLGMGLPTVKGHVSRLLTKLELNNQTQVAVLVQDAELL